MTIPVQPLIALMAALDLPAGAEVPEWVHVLPAGTGILTYDNRGPYRVADAAAVIAASMADPRGMLIDANHSTDIAAPKGGDAPAHGWIKALEARADGIWAQVDWNASGRALLADRSYRGISPVIEHLEDGTILRIKRASLTNVPNLQRLNALNMESPVTLSLIARLAPLLGLTATATEDQIVAAIPRPDTALQSTMAAIGITLGVDAGNGAAVLAAVQALQSAQATVSTQAARIEALETAQKKSSAEAWMNGLIAAKRGIPADKRQGLISLHMQDATQAQAVADLYPNLGPVALGQNLPPEAGAPLTALNAEQRAVADVMGIKPETYLATLNAERAQKEA